MNSADQLEKERQLASDILDYARDAIIAQMPYLSRALIEMPVRWYGEESAPQDITIGFGTDGEYFYCMPVMAVRRFNESPAEVVHIYLHSILHCLLNHMFGYENMNPDLYDFSCDLAVESIIESLNWDGCRTKEDESRKQALFEIQAAAGDLKADNLYHFFDAHRETAEHDLKYADLFRLDLHHYWLKKDQEGRQFVGEGASSAARTKVQHKWKGLERAVKNEIESYEKTQGYEPGTILKKFTLQPQKKDDYTEFLRKFSVSSEEVHVNPDEFDYVYYTYGLSLYRNMPLIEPLEYREDNRIREFAVAIDTSGSVQGRLVRAFLQKTWEILSSSDNFFSSVNIHIMQCDSKIQEEATVHNESEFQDYMKHLEIKGFGGTDFRPVFRRINEMIDAHEFTNLKGLLYFTDGKGIYPSSAPSYKTAFIFIDNGTQIPQVPAWAIRKVLHDDSKENV